MDKHTQDRVAEMQIYTNLSKWILRALALVFLLGVVTGSLFTKATAADWRSPDDRLRTQAEAQERYRNEQRLRDLENQQYIQDRRQRELRYESDVRSADWLYRDLDKK